MSALEVAAVLLAGAAAGTINAVVGSGTLITFPALLSVGYAPVVANVSNAIGLVPGTAASIVGYRHELRGQRRRMLLLGTMTMTGAIAGAIALLVAPESAFEAIVPGFIAIALVLIVLQPRLARGLAQRRAARGDDGAGAEANGGLRVVVLLTGVYGGYFGAAQGILLLSVLGVALPDDLQRLNALKNVLAGIANLVAGVVFVLVADVAWTAVALIAGGAALGGWLGARYGRRLPPGALRTLVVAVGLFAIGQLLL